MGSATTELKGLLLDMDGVIAEVKQSYRQCIVDTCKAWEVSVTFEDITVEKLKGNANNDWVLSRKMLADRGVEASLQEVTDTFEGLYKELCKLETLIPADGVFERLHAACRGRLAIVTGRPRRDCDIFLRRFDLEKFVVHSVCMEDGPPKPAPQPVLSACKALGLEPAETVMVGDTVDDVKAAVAAGGRAVGTLLPDDYERVRDGGAAAYATVPSAAAMLECGAEQVIKPGLEDLLALFNKA